MWKFSSVSLQVLSCVFIASCASEQKVSYSKGEKKQFGERWMSDVKFATDENGGAVWQNSKRSGFERQSGFSASKDFKGKSFNKGEFSKKSWGQNTHYAQKAYQGNTDGSKYQRAPYFANKSTAEQGKLARVGEKGYTAGNYYGANAKADVGRKIAKPLDAETGMRRRVYTAPPIQESDGYNGMSIKETNSLLGR